MSSIDDIRAEIEASRHAMQRDYSALRAELNFVAKTKNSVASNPLPWLGGSALIGWVLSGRKRRKARKLKAGQVAEPVKRFTILGVLFALVRLFFPILQPHLTSFAVGKLTDYVGQSRKSRGVYPTR
jgi:hypothetical protein